MCSYGPMMMGGGGKVAFLLIALALGYWVLNQAENNPNPLKLVGRMVGWLILIVSLGGLVCSAMCGLCKSKKMCGGMKKECAMAAPMEAPPSDAPAK